MNIEIFSESETELRELQYKLRDELISQPSRIITTQLEGATKYELSMSLRYFSFFKHFRRRVSKNGKAWRDYYEKGCEEYIVIDKGEAGDRNDVILCADRRKLAEEIEQNCPCSKYEKPRTEEDSMLDLTYRHLDKAYFNSEKIPIHKNPDGPKTTVVDYMAFTQFDNGAAQFQIRRANVVIGVNRKDNSLIANTVGFTNYFIDIEKEGKVSIKKNGRLILDAKQITEFFDTAFFNVFFSRTKTKHADTLWFRNKIQASLLRSDIASLETRNYLLWSDSFIGLYSVLHHQILEKLPWDFISLCSMYRSDHFLELKTLQIKVVLERLQASDIDAAIDACFYDVKLPEVIRSLFLERHFPLGCNPDMYHLIKRCCDMVGADKILYLLKTESGGVNNRLFINNGLFFEALIIGLSHEEVKHYAMQEDLKSFIGYFSRVYKTMQMYNKLKEKQINISVSEKSVAELHDSITAAYNQ